ncbi:replication factor C large subunit [Sulfuracidifex tepidarius]|uniref:Replication factor C large subunit n=1 Tax=Sulfuracidifex tepidarius TaxID=1294262 RepID=A0A510DUQ6_9CREN|nr:replication factor C large subunit [Sulfuracidifex tepidarius]BBG23952.1 Replication factor C large subunit [Sulfuracidifex tepidarius]BBG26707.1 Replication factor C large subunit [Sulfuracidifex tepidarius]
MSNLQWFIKYRPKSLSEVENQEEAKEELKSWIESWIQGKPKYKAVLLNGPPGVGKTTIAEALARDYNMELLEMNASDSRRLNDIREIAERASTSSSLFGKGGRLILLDEVDGINSRQDAGAIPGILDVIERSRFPIILTANNAWDPSLRELRTATKMIDLQRLGKIPLKKILERICKAEKVICDPKGIGAIADLSEGDARYAINMLQSVAEVYRKVTEDLVKDLVRKKDRTLDPFETLRGIFWAKYFWQARVAATTSEVDYELLLRWLSENVPIQFDDMGDVFRGFDALSRASVFLKRSKLGDWDLLSYVFDLMGPGVAFAEYSKLGGQWKAKWKKYQFPTYVQQMSKSKDSRDALKTASEKIAKATHCSSDKVITDYVPFMKFMKVEGFSPEEIKVMGNLEGRETDEHEEGKERTTRARRTRKRT